MSSGAQRRQVKRASSAIFSVVQVLSPDSAPSLWQAVQQSKCVEQHLGIQSSIDTKYLQALAETYQNASSWSTKRQLLAVMADLVTYNELRHYIPRLTDYRFKMARLHLMKFGRGVPVPMETRRSVRVDEERLDVFLSFITSPHIVQDLPFGQKYVRLSNGDILETQSVIRAMIPARIYAQYQQYCTEDDHTPVSESTARRILAICPATTRKSLQGLDYLSAEGAKAFDTLADVVRQLEGIGKCDHAWISSCETSLKQSKQYLKSDYKVT